MTKLSKEQDAATQELIGKLSDVAEQMATAADDADAYFDEKSEKWQEGEKGQAYSGWKDNLRAAADALSEAQSALEAVNDSPE